MSIMDKERRQLARLDFLFGTGQPSQNNGVGRNRQNQPSELPFSNSTANVETSLLSGEAFRLHAAVSLVDDEKACPEDLKIITSTKSQSHEHPKTSNMETLANFIKGNVGTGILSLPYGMKNAGLLVGTISTLIVGFICHYCMHQLLNAYKKVGQGRNMDYADVAEEVFAQSKYRKLNACARASRHVTNASLIFTQIGICCVYLVFCPKMIKEVVDFYYPHLSTTISLVSYQAAITVLMIPYCFVTTLHILSIFSMIANAIMIGCLCIILQFVFRNLKRVDDLPLATDSTHFFAFFGSVMFAFESISLVLPLENRMKDREAFGRWNGLMSLGMTIIIALYTGMGFYGYLAFGEDSKLILRNLPDHWVYHATKIAWMVGIFISFNLQLYVPVQIIWPSLKPKFSARSFCDKYGEYLLRTLLVLLTFALAAIIPCLEQMISLVGALAMSWLALCIPAILDLVSELPQKRRPGTFAKARSFSSTTRLIQSQKSVSSSNTGTISDVEPGTTGNFWHVIAIIRCLVIFLMGVAGATAGTYVNVMDIASLLQSPGGCGV